MLILLSETRISTGIWKGADRNTGTTFVEEGALTGVVLRTVDFLAGWCLIQVVDSTLAGPAGVMMNAIQIVESLKNRAIETCRKILRLSADKRVRRAQAMAVLTTRVYQIITKPSGESRGTPVKQHMTRPNDKVAVRSVSPFQGRLPRHAGSNLVVGEVLADVKS